MTTQDATVDIRINPALMAGMGVGTFAYYALPDVIRSRTARGLIKTGLVAAMTGAYLATDIAKEREEAADEAGEELVQKLEQYPAPLVATGAAALLAGGIALTVWGEKAIFARGERRRLLGVRAAHTRQAAGLGLLGVLAGLGL